VRQVFAVPERGDVVLITFPSSGRPRGAAARLAVAVLSPQAYNARVGLALTCPIVARATGYPFEVRVPPDLSVAGVILADQPASLDWRARRSEKAGSLPTAVVDEVLGKLRALLIRDPGNRDLSRL